MRKCDSECIQSMKKKTLKQVLKQSAGIESVSTVVFRVKLLIAEAGRENPARRELMSTWLPPCALWRMSSGVQAW
jgi:hypothetical protein